MPCYQVNLVSVEFKAKHVNLIEASAKELGWAYSATDRYVIAGTVKIDLEKQLAQVDSYNVDAVNRLKQEYGRQAVLAAQKKLQKGKWFVKQINRQKLELRAY